MKKDTQIPITIRSLENGIEKITVIPSPVEGIFAGLPPGGYEWQPAIPAAGLRYTDRLRLISKNEHNKI